MGENYLRGEGGGRWKEREEGKRKERQGFRQSIKTHCGLNVKDGNI